MVLYVLPKAPIPDDHLVGLIVDSRDRRHGEIFRVGAMWEDDMRWWAYINHICTDGTTYTSRYFSPGFSAWQIESIKNSENPKVRGLIPDVGPPALYYRFPNSDLLASQIMSANGRGFEHLISAFLEMNHGIHTLDKLRADYLKLFEEPLPLEQIRA